MKIGVVPMLDSSAGGIYQYCRTMLDAFCRLKKEGDKNEIIVFVDDQTNSIVEELTKKGLYVELLRKNDIKMILKNRLSKFPSVFNLFSKLYISIHFGQKNILIDEISYNKKMDFFFKKLRIDLMYYPAPNTLCFETDIPYILSIHDLQHKINPRFPEVSADGELERREYLYKNGSKKASLILVDSETGKEDVLKYYGKFGVKGNKIRVLPYLPSVEKRTSNSSDVKNKYKLPEKYIFYPAQFWQHKNHAGLVKALGILKKEKGMDIPLVLCGSLNGKYRKEVFEELIKLADEADIKDNIYFLGYVQDEDLKGLYVGARALVMPTFFGPTNIPVLEAWSIGIPVLTSNIRGIREQAGDVALLVDPDSTKEIASGIYRLWTDEDYCLELINKGYKKTKEYTFEHYYQKFKKIILESIKDRKKSDNLL